MNFLMFYCIGLSDPYVKGRLGPCKFQTQIQRKTLSPKWFEEFKIPITSWEASNELVMEVCDKDHLYDDSLGYVLFSDLIFVK
jgi:Ca2+-dependent lipid-binding protein